jgi:type I restriction enzyme, S subunit
MSQSSNWKSCILRDICEKVQYGYTAKAISKPVGPKILRITDIVPEKIDWEKVPYCIIDPNESEKYLLEVGDIVIARTGATTGYAKYIKEQTGAIFASYLIRIHLKKDVDSRFISFLIESNRYKEFISTSWSGAAQPNANAQVLTSFPLSLPPLPTQHKIASILSAYDDLIENNLRRIKILEEMAQRIYREWFVKFRFPGHENVPLVDSPLGKIPKGWEVTKIGKVIELAYGKSLRKDERKGGAVPVFGSSGVVGYHDQAMVKGPGIIVGRKGNVGKIYWSQTDFCPIDTVYYVQTSLPLSYVYYNLQTQNFVNNDAAVPGLNRNQAHSLSIVIPKDEILQRFHEISADFFEFNHDLTCKNKILYETRDTLLSQIFLGKSTFAVKKLI